MAAILTQKARAKIVIKSPESANRREVSSKPPYQSMGRNHVGQRFPQGLNHLRIWNRFAFGRRMESSERGSNHLPTRFPAQLALADNILFDNTASKFVRVSAPKGSAVF